MYLYEPFHYMVTQASVRSSGLHEGFSAQSNPFQSAFTKKRWFKEQEKGLERGGGGIKNHSSMKTEL